MPVETIRIGVLALQGAFAEHQAILQRLPACSTSKPNTKASITSILVRTPEELETCDALIIPGGESTTMALLAKLNGLLEPLREFVQSRPVWGTCAGAILLSREVIGTKKGGQEGIGGIDIKIGRNGWGSQIESFEAELDIEGMRDAGRPFVGVFIRAPVVLDITPTTTGLPIQVIARVPRSLVPMSANPESASELELDEDDQRRIVALRQGRHLLTTFHPELTKDNRFHEYFVKHCVLGVGSGSTTPNSPRGLGLTTS